MRLRPGARQRAGVDGLGDRGQSRARIERRLRGPAARPLPLGSLPMASTSGDKLVDALDVTIEQRHPEAVSSRVARKIAARRREAADAQISNLAM